MKKLIVIINPNDVIEAKKHLDTFTTGRFLLPNIYEMKVPDEDLESAVTGIEYILAGLDFHIVDEYYINQKENVI